MKWLRRKRRGVRRWEASPQGAVDINQRMREQEKALIAYQLDRLVWFR